MKVYYTQGGEYWLGYYAATNAADAIAAAADSELAEDCDGDTAFSLADIEARECKVLDPITHAHLLGDSAIMNGDIIRQLIALKLINIYSDGDMSYFYEPNGGIDKFFCKGSDNG